MPNWISNSVMLTHDNPHKLKELADIFEAKRPFNTLVPQPDWPNTPLMTGQEKSFGTVRGHLGELPQYTEDPWKRLVFKSTGQSDDRWYDWRLQNWDTKWDAYDVVVTDDDPDCTEIEFNTAWSPPEAICLSLIHI